MANFFIHNITLFHLVDPVEIQHYNCYFRHATGIAEMSKGVVTDSSGSITIPTTSELSIEEGDIIVEGNIGTFTSERELIEDYKCYRVIKVHDNRKGKLQHYKLEVQD